MKKEIVKLREYMKAAGVDAYYVPYGDFHCSEYVSDHFKVTEFLTGFTGESATLIVSEDGAWLWTDGRFFLQANKQLAGTGIEMMKMGEEGVPTPGRYIAEMAAGRKAGGFVLGFDGKAVPASFKAGLDKSLEEAGSDISIKCDEDLADIVWKDRPAIEAGKIWELPLESAGMSRESKVKAVRGMMAEEGADYLLLTDLMETAWLFNLRGSDIQYTPVFYSFTLISPNMISLYVMNDCLGEDITKRIGDDLGGVMVKPYDKIYEDIAGIEGGTLWLDSASCNYGLRSSIGTGVRLIDKKTPPALLKIVKNDREIECSERAHIKDGVAVTKLIKWFREAVKDPEEGEESASGLTEIDVAGKLHEFRAEQEGFIEESFETISAYGENAAIVHYAPTEETNAAIRPEGFLLLDSGGQYIDGTTDITRTIAAGPLTREMIEYYTYVLKAHIAMAMFEAGEGKDGKDVDEAARKPLQDHGLDFNHGLSHGVGHVLGVHEGPNAVSRKEPETDIRAGMIMSNEPGVYIEGGFGIRIEDLVVWKENENGCLVNEALTCVPYEREAIDKSLLTDEEIEWVDDYHKRVFDTLSPLVDEYTAEFLAYATAPL